MLNFNKAIVDQAESFVSKYETDNTGNNNIKLEGCAILAKKDWPSLSVI
jgi:hypothetical protein